MNKINASIVAVGGFVPEYILTNSELELMVDTSDKWIRERTGISERRILKGHQLATSDMAVSAIRNLLEVYSVNASTIDCLILATATPDYGLAPASSLICSKAGLKNAWGFDMNGACSGFLYALTVGSSFIESGRYKNVLVVGADKMSSIVDYTDRNTSILFGDGAAAVLLNEADGNAGIMHSIFRTDGEGTENLLIPAGGSMQPANTETVTQHQHFIKQDGKKVFRQAVKNMYSCCKELMELARLDNESVNWIIPHQANYRIIQSISDELNIPMEKFKINIEKYGNTTSATIPLCLWDFKNDFKKGDNMIITAFGAGFNCGSTYIKW